MQSIEADENSNKLLSSARWLTDYVVQNLGDVASIAGLAITIVGFLVTISKVNKSKELARISVDQVKKVIAVGDITEAIRAAEEIKRLQREREWRVLPDRYSLLRKLLIDIRSNNELDDDDKKMIQSTLALLTSLERQVDQFLETDNSEEIRVSKMNHTLTRKADDLQELLNRIRNLEGVGL